MGGCDLSDGERRSRVDGVGLHKPVGWCEALGQLGQDEPASG